MAPDNELTQIELTVFFDAACCVCAADGRLSGRETVLVLARLREANVRAPEEELKSLMQRRAAEIYKHGLDRAGANVACAIRETTNPRLRTLIRSTLPPLVEADGKRSAREVQAARILLDACDEPPPAPIGEGRPSASSPVSTSSAVAVWVVPSVIGAFALVVVMFTVWIVRSTNRADEEAANGRLTVAMTAAQEWIDGTSKVEADVIEQQLVKAIADRYVTDKTAGDAMLERLRGHREALAERLRIKQGELEALALWDDATRLIAASRVPEAVEMLQKYLNHPHAADRNAARALQAEAEMALSDEKAFAALMTMADADFQQATTTGEIHDGTVTNPALIEVRKQTIKRASVAASRRRLEMQEAERIARELELAVSLVNKQAHLACDNLPEITVEAARAFGQHQGDSLSLNRVIAISPEVARELAQFRGRLSLDGLSTLTPETARELANFRGALSLNGLADISLDVASALAGFAGESLSLDGLKRLSSDQAKAFAFKAGRLRLNSLSDLDANAAAALAATCVGADLELNGLTTLSPSTASQLVRLGGDLSLDSLRSLSPELATALSAAKGDLALNGLTTLSAGAASAIAGFAGSKLSLNGVKSLGSPEVGPEVARALSLCEGDHLSLDGVLILSSRESDALGAFRGKLLSLNGLNGVPDSVARGLAKLASRGSGLELNGVKRLSDEAVAYLARIREGPDVLSLNGLTELSPETAAGLALSPGGELRLGGLRSLSLDAARNLAMGPTHPIGHKGILVLNGVTDVSVGVAEALSYHIGHLDLSGLKRISSNAARALARHKRGLNLDGISELSGESAQELAKLQCALSLNGLAELPEEVARALAQHKDFLYLNGLRNMSAKAADALAQRQYVSLQGLYEAPDEIARKFPHSQDIRLPKKFDRVRPQTR